MLLRANYSPSSPLDKDAQEEAEGEGEDTMLLLMLRWLLPPAKAEEKVVFRCPFDGWYYKGEISKDNQDFSYIISDCNNDLVTIWREDIICDDDKKADNLKTGDTVIVLHPDYIESYCPGQMESESRVRLFDGKVTTTGSGYVARLSPNKYISDVAVMTALAEAWTGTTVVARDGETGEYHIGTVTGLSLDSYSRYNIWWDNSSTESTVDAIHVFGSLTPHRALAKNDHVLAPAPIKDAPNAICYLPAKIESLIGDEMVVTFQLLPGSGRVTVKTTDCFWVAERYYLEAVVRYLQYHFKEDKS